MGDGLQKMWDVGDEVFCAKQETIFGVKQSRRWKISKQEVGDGPKKSRKWEMRGQVLQAPL